MNNDEIKSVLSSGEFDPLIGVLETEHADFKVQPYQLATEKQKYDLLEDIVAFANHEGGIIVLGCRTTTAAIEGDVVAEVRPIPRDRLDFEAYRSLVNEFIHPQVKGLGFFYYPDRNNQLSGLALIDVPQASDADSPHLISHIVNDASGRKTTRACFINRFGLKRATSA